MPVTAFLETPRFPVDISEGARGGPEFSTEVFTAVSGAEQRNMLWSEARCKYDVGFGIREKDDMLTVIDFFYACRGRATGFRFKDWTDYEIVAETAQPYNGSTTVFQISKNYTVGSQTYSRAIRKPIDGTLSAVTANAVAVVEDTDFTVDYTTGLMTFGSAPAQPVVVGLCEFDVPVRFDTDNLEITAEAAELESIQSIPLVEIRPNA
jgi:uncharacterized protein (TIGR02217 family)